MNDDDSLPSLSMHSPEQHATELERPNSQQLELEMARLRIKELEMRIELERISNERKYKSNNAASIENDNKVEQSNTSLLASAIERRLELPKREIQHFDGNPKNYWAFTRAFQSTIESRTNDDETRLSYLIQYCDGPAKAQIQHCTVLEPTEGFPLAKDILHRRFGQNYMVARAFIDDLLHGQPIPEGDSQSLMELAQQLMICDVTLRQMNYLSDLNSRSTIQSIVARLPSRLRFKWAKAAANIRKLDREPDISDLATFIEDRVDGLCSDYGELALSLSLAERSKRRTIIRSDQTIGRRNIHTNQTLIERQDPRRVCLICKDLHFTDQCTEFINMSLAERRETVKRQKLCNICLKANHVAKDCMSRRHCTVQGCGGNHHRLLHPESLEDQLPKVSSHLVSRCPLTSQNTNTRSVALAVIPVLLKNGSHVSRCGAFIDNGSDSSFITKSAADALHLNGQPTKLILKTMTSDLPVHSSEVAFDVRACDSATSLHVARAWIVDRLPHIKRIVPNEEQIKSWPHLRNIPFSNVDDCEIGILLKTDVPGAHVVIEQRMGCGDQPFAIKLPLGWTLMGPISGSRKQARVNHSTVADIERDLERFYQQDVIDSEPVKEKEMSVNDRRALAIMENSITLQESHYEICLPWVDKPDSLPDNKYLAMKRVLLLKGRLLKNDGLRSRYCDVMNEYIRESHAEPTPEIRDTWKWYLPHHPVFHPMKPNKLRIVFDCAAKFNGISLNDKLLSGPDLNNSLIGVLLRFRQEKVAVMADIKSMFHQVRVPEQDRNALRFLWWKDENLQGLPVEYRMCVHLFGATSSPSCATFALRRTITDNEHAFDADVIRESKRCFYVDDCLFSTGDLEDATRFCRQLKVLLAKGGFNLTKWVSNYPEVLKLLREFDGEVESVCLTPHESTMQRTLGLNWDLKEDTYRFYCQPMNERPTRRNLLSYVASFYDPLGYVAPIILIAKVLLQRLSKQKLDWDQTIENKELEMWTKWTSSVGLIQKLVVPRCLKDPSVDGPIVYQLHTFSDASDTAYGAVAYLLLINSAGMKSCQLLMAKARVAPIRVTTVPRLELAAAVMSAKLAKQIQAEMTITISSKYFWSDSLVVLHSIRNTSKRFPTYFANRLSTIHEHTDVTEWRYVDTKQNPADLLSRGVLANERKKLERWIKGPMFLLHEDHWPHYPHEEGTADFSSLPTCTSNHIESVTPGILSRFSNTTSWCKLVRLISWLLRYKHFLMKKPNLCTGALTVSDIRSATTEIARLVQLEAFPTEMSILRKSHSNAVHNRNVCLPHIPSSPLRKLSPVVMGDVLRVGGRLQQAHLPFDTKHPIILPSNHFVTRLLIQHYHTLNGHLGLTFLISCLRQRYWILKATKTIKSVLNHCFKCRRWFGQPYEQVMAPLPTDRILVHQDPFTATGVDYFGPLYVKRKRTVEKRYGCLFTCLTSRAVHIEISESLDTDSFLCAFTRFVARRGCPQRLYSDNGSNFKAAEVTIKALLKTWNQEKINRALMVRDCDWIFHPPRASHRGGVWERIIRSIKRSLVIILEEQPITDEVLHTTLLEVERILNDRPLVKQTDDPDDQYILSPNKLLLLKENKSVLIPEENLSQRLGRRWLQAQYLADLFWKHWLRRYLPTLQIKQGWLKIHRNIKTGELVLLRDDSAPRGQWLKAVVEEVVRGTDGMVRDVLVRTNNGVFRRDVRQLCALEGNLYDDKENLE